MAIHYNILCISAFLFVVQTDGNGLLSLNYYQETCPYLEQIVNRTTAEVQKSCPSLLRLHFHDCFVRGCDGSVLLNSNEDNEAEKDAHPNLTLAGFPQIDLVKAVVEENCPDIVSCADILALVARDCVSQVGGPYYPVLTGRRDGVVSSASEAIANLPLPTFNIDQLKTLFASKGLNEMDLVVLSGAHTIGFSSCESFSNRLYNFSVTNNVDPTLDPEYAITLEGKCPRNVNNHGIVMDFITPLTFDHNYFYLLNQNKGLFQSDVALLNDTTTKLYVEAHTSSMSDQLGFFEDFGVSMAKMGMIQVLTGDEGEIRKICSQLN